MQVKTKITKSNLEYLVCIVTEAEKASIYMVETPLRYFHIKKLKEEVGIKLYKANNNFKNFSKKEFNITFNEHQLESLDKVVETLFLDDESNNLYRLVYLKMLESVHRYSEGLISEMYNRQGIAEEIKSLEEQDMYKARMLTLINP